MLNLKTGKHFAEPSARSVQSQMTRREFGKGIASILAAGVAPSVAVGGLRRGLAARTGMMAVGGNGWVNPYVTDGLVAMWDAEWNAGGGIHGSQPIMVDLSGNGNDATVTQSSTGTPTVGDKYFAFSGNSALGFNANGALGSFSNSPITIEMVVKYNTIYDSSSNVFAFSLLPQNQSIYSNYGYRATLNYGSYITCYTYGTQIQVHNSYLQEIHNLTSVYAGGSTQRIYIGNVFVKNSSNGFIPMKKFCTGGYIGYGPQGQNLDGNIYSIRIYAKELSKSDLTHNYNLDYSRFF